MSLTLLLQLCNREEITGKNWKRLLQWIVKTKNQYKGKIRYVENIYLKYEKLSKNLNLQALRAVVKYHKDLKGTKVFAFGCSVRNLKNLEKPLLESFCCKVAAWNSL